MCAVAPISPILAFLLKIYPIRVVFQPFSPWKQERKLWFVTKEGKRVNGWKLLLSWENYFYTNWKPGAIYAFFFFFSWNPELNEANGFTFWWQTTAGWWNRKLFPSQETLFPVITDFALSWIFSLFFFLSLTSLTSPHSLPSLARPLPSFCWSESLSQWVWWKPIYLQGKSIWHLHGSL